MRSFLAGSATALVLGTIGLVVASLTVAPPEAETPVPVAEAAPVAEPPAAVPQDAPDVTPPTPEPQVAPEVPAPAPVLQPDPPAPAPEPLQAPEPEPTPEPAPEPEPAAPAVRINRPGADAAPEPVADVLPVLTPLVRYAADVDYPADLPLVAVVLLDDPSVPDAPALIAALPFMPSVVLNAGAADVTARMRAYRAAGVEVLVTADLPQGAQPSDVEITYQAAFAAVPEAIAVFAGDSVPETGAVADQVMALIAADGRGYVTAPRGLGAMRPVADSAVPTAQISRDVDSAAEPQATVERNLAQVSFRARQTGSAVLLGRATPETLEAVRIWSSRSDPGQVSLVPVSAVLIAQLPPP